MVSGDKLEPGRVRSEIDKLFRGVARAMLTLMMCMTGGMDWGEAGEALLNINIFYLLLFVVFIVLVLFSVLNVLAAVNVQQALTLKDRKIIYQEQLQSTHDFFKEMRELFSEANTDHNESLSRSEFDNYLQSEQAMVYLSTHQLDAHDLRNIFDMLDIN